MYSCVIIKKEVYDKFISQNDDFVSAVDEFENGGCGTFHMYTNKVEFEVEDDDDAYDTSELEETLISCRVPYVKDYGTNPTTGEDGGRRIFIPGDTQDDDIDIDVGRYSRGCLVDEFAIPFDTIKGYMRNKIKFFEIMEKILETANIW